jgi:hypothetical protein
MNSKTQKASFRRETPEGDTHECDVCAACGFIDDVNPKIVTGSVVRHRGRILLCRRAIDRLLAVYTIPRIAQVQIMYLAHLEDEAFSAGQESLEVMLAGWDEIPWGATSPSPLLPGRWSNTAASKDRMTSRLSPIPKGNMPA